MATQSQDEKEQRQEQSGNRQSQSQRSTPPKGGDRTPEHDQGQDQEGHKSHRHQENKIGNPKDARDPGGISPQDDLA